MCAVRGRLGIGSVLQEDVRHPCRRWRTSRAKMAHIPGGQGRRLRLLRIINSVVSFVYLKIYKFGHCLTGKY